MKNITVDIFIKNEVDIDTMGDNLIYAFTKVYMMKSGLIMSVS